MTTFRFPLERVLEWRKLQMRAEEEKLAALQHRLGLINQRINVLSAAEMKSESGLRKLPTVSGAELHTVAAFQTRVKKHRAALDLELKQCQKLVEAQRARLLQARKNYRVLEKLKERRHEAWSYEMNRELENAAADSHISKLVRSRSEE